MILRASSTVSWLGSASELANTMPFSSSFLFMVGSIDMIHKSLNDEIKISSINPNPRREKRDNIVDRDEPVSKRIHKAGDRDWFDCSQLHAMRFGD